VQDEAGTASPFIGARDSEALRQLHERIAADRSWELNERELFAGGSESTGGSVERVQAESLGQAVEPADMGWSTTAVVSADIRRAACTDGVG
jgi:hypothetical protein